MSNLQPNDQTTSNINTENSSSAKTTTTTVYTAKKIWLRYEVLTSEVVQFNNCMPGKPPASFTMSVSDALNKGAQLAGGITSSVIHFGQYHTHIQFHQAIVYSS